MKTQRALPHISPGSPTKRETNQRNVINVKGINLSVAFGMGEAGKSSHWMTLITGKSPSWRVAHEKWGEMIPFLWTNRPESNRSYHHGPLCVVAWFSDNMFFGKWLSRTRVEYIPSYCKIKLEKHVIKLEKDFWFRPLRIIVRYQTQMAMESMDNVILKILWLSDSNGFVWKWWENYPKIKGLCKTAFPHHFLAILGVSPPFTPTSWGHALCAKRGPNFRQGTWARLLRRRPRLFFFWEDDFGNGKL